MDRETAILYRRMIETAAESLSDENALQAPEMFPHWKVDMDVTAGERMFHNDKLYRVVQDHRTQADWAPDITPALFTEVALPGEIPVWKQPTGAQDAYMTGDKVHYPTETDPVYESTVDNNVWAPGVYGWTQID